jgi:hypothetical protein
MRTTTHSKATRVELRPALNQRARKATSAPTPSPSGLSREELRALVLEMIG